MLGRLNLYKFYLRIVVYAVPLLAIAAALSIHLPWVLDARHTAELSRYIHLWAFVSLIWSIVSERYQLTSISKLLKENSGVVAASVATAVTYALSVTVLFFSGHFVVSRIVVALSAIATVLFTVLVRILVRTSMRKGKRWQRPNRILLVGTDKFARRVAWRLTHDPFTAALIAGYVRMPGQEVVVRDAKIYDLQEIADRPPNSEFDDVVIAVRPERFAALSQVMKIMEGSCVPLRVVIDLDNVILRNSVFQLGRLQMINVATTPAESVNYLLLKRAFDILFSLLVLIVTAPLMGAIALVIRLSSPGPILFSQDRVGLNGKIFRMLKFRTMSVSERAASDTAWTIPNDPRRTRFGSFLRATSLDELPQFFNVLVGEMSVVGPRPERPHFVRKFQRDYTHYNHRHFLKVGITGLAQVHGFRGDTSIRKRVQYDLYYLQNWSLWLDLRIIFLTVVSGLVNSHAY